MLVIRGRVRYMVPVLAVVALGFLITPSTDGRPGRRPGRAGPSAPVAVERLTSDVPDRLALWTSATLMMIDHPLTGVGPGQTLVVAATNPERYIQTRFGYAANNAHNTILLAGAETGIVGAIGAFIVNLAIALAAVRVLLETATAADPGDRGRGCPRGPWLSRPGDGQQPVQRGGGREWSSRSSRGPT